MVATTWPERDPNREEAEKLAGVEATRQRFQDFTEVYLTSRAFNLALDNDEPFFYEIRGQRRYLAYQGHYWVWTDRDTAMRIKLTWAGM